MHITYPAKHGYFTWDELGCLARGLGFPANTFYDNLPNDVKKDKDSIKISTLYDMMDRFEYFSMAMNQTFNAHSAEWNLNAMKKVIPLLHNKIITFAEVLHVRLAYQVYEEIDTKGMIINEHSGIRSLKLCGRQISPLKMVNRIKHMSEHFEEAGRMQLHEFFDLLLWCTHYKDPQYKHTRSGRLGEDGELFKLADFKSLLRHYDEELFAQLNDEYMHEEWRFSREKHQSKSMPKDVLPVNPETRIQQVKYHKQRYKPLHREITRSTCRVRTAQADHVRPRPISAPDLPSQHESEGRPYSYGGTPVQRSRPTSVLELSKRFMQRPPTNSTCTRDDIRHRYPLPPYDKYIRPTTPAVVTDADVVDTHNLIQTLKFKQQTMNAKYRVMLYEDLEALIPGISEKMEAFVPPDPPLPTPPPSVISDHEEPPSPETLRRLSSPNKREPLPSHARICDARYRGWYDTQTVPGKHWILDGATYDKSPHGDLLNKLQALSNTQGSHSNYMIRQTTVEQALDDPMRPKTAQGLTPTSHSTKKVKRRKTSKPRFTFSFNEDNNLSDISSIDNVDQQISDSAEHSTNAMTYLTPPTSSDRYDTTIDRSTSLGTFPTTSATSDDGFGRPEHDGNMMFLQQITDIKKMERQNSSSEDVIKDEDVNQSAVVKSHEHQVSTDGKTTQAESQIGVDFTVDGNENDITQAQKDSARFNKSGNGVPADNMPLCSTSRGQKAPVETLRIDKPPSETLQNNKHPNETMRKDKQPEGTDHDSKSTLSKRSSVVITDGSSRKRTPKSKSKQNKPIIGILRKESLEQHNLRYDDKPHHVSVRDDVETVAIVTTETPSAPIDTMRTNTTQSSSDRYTYISEDVRPLIAQTPTWFGEVLKREFIPPGPPTPSARSYNRLAQSAGISQRLKRQLQSKASICKRGNMTPSQTKHNSFIATY